MTDVWEVANGLNPDDASDAGGDPDGDGYNNLAEFQRGTDPHVADVSPEEMQQPTQTTNENLETNETGATEPTSTATEEELIEGLTSASNACYAISGGCAVVAVVAAATGVGLPIATLFGALAGGFGILGAAFGEAANQAANGPDPLP
jgi:hypothetical protein